MAIVGSQSIAEAVPSAGLTDYSTYASLPTDTDYAQLNRVGVWRDTAAEGNPWVPMYLEDWTLVTSLHADTVNLASLPTGWSDLSSSPGSVSIVGDRMRAADGGSGGYGRLYFVFPSLSAGEDLVIVQRGQVVDANATESLNSVLWQFGDARTNEQSAFQPNSGAASPSEMFIAFGYATNPGPAGGAAAGQTAERVYVSEIAAGGTSDEGYRAWVMEDNTIVSFCAASALTRTLSTSYVMSHFGWNHTGSDTCIVDCQFIAIYKK